MLNSATVEKVVNMFHKTKQNGGICKFQFVISAPTTLTRLSIITENNWIIYLDVRIVFLLVHVDKIGHSNTNI